MATKKQATKPAPKPARKPLPTTTKPSSLDLVRNPNFDSAMAQKNYANFMAAQQARLASQRGQQNAEDIYNRLNKFNIGLDPQARLAAERGTPTPPSGPLGGPVGSPRSKRDPSKEIILNFAGGEYGIRNDAAANEIAKKYNLEIVRNPDPNSALPNYIFKSNGNVSNIISRIKNEPGIGYAEQNFVMKSQPVLPDRTSQPRPSSPDLQNQFTQGRLMGAPSGGMGGNVQLGQEPIPPFIPKGMGGSVQYGQEPIPPFIPKGMGGSIGASENMRSPNMPQDIRAAYDNFLQQGIQRSNIMNQGAMIDFANMQPGMQATQPATAATPKPAMPVAGMGMQQSNSAPRKFSTVNTPSARFG